jgi:hypothetical protein
MTAVRYSHGRAARFYVPLLLQAFAQSFTYPLVGSIVSACDAGVNALSAFSIGQVVMFMIFFMGVAPLWENRVDKRFRCY